MGWRLLAATLATAVLALAGLVIGASPASAHNVLKSTSPADGKKVARTPSSVVLTFDEPAIALGTKLVITGPEGPVQMGKPSLIDNTVTQDLQPGSPAGAYTVDWRVTSADGHPISGSFTFTAEAAAASVPSTAPSLAPQPSPAPAAPTAPTARGSSGLWLVAAAILVVASGLIAIGRRRRLTSGDRS
jgi:copper resistance protein C